jgi:YD repeat-containing protein
MYKILAFVLINMLWVGFSQGASENVAVFPAPVYIDGGVEFPDLDSAYTHLKSRYERTEPWGNGVATYRIISISPWVNAYNPSYNGVATKYVTELERCLPDGCSISSAGTINVSMRCAESVSFTAKVIGTDIDRTLHCVRSIPVEVSKSDCDKVGNPILVATGEKIQRETDYRSSNGVLEFSRTYRAGGGSGESASIATVSFTDNSNPLFKPSGCFSSFYTENTVEKKRVPYCFKYVVSPIVGDFDYTVRLESGRKLLFKNVSGQIKNQGSTGEKLFKRVDELGVDEWVLHNTDGSVIFFDVNGRIKRMQLRTGKITTYSYSTADTPTNIAPSAGVLIEVADDQGRKLQFKYNNLLQITKMIDPHGNSFSYTYDNANNLTSVTYPTGDTRHYLFAEPGNINNGVACSGSSNAFLKLLTGIVDEKGIRYADYKYDCLARGVSTEHAGGAQKVLLAFNSDGSTTVTNALNKKTIFRFKNIAGVKHISSIEGQASTSCSSANKAYTYTAEGWLASVTDWKGFKTTFTYNMAGQEISRTEAFGTPEARTIITEWHPTLFVKTKITEPEKETIYNYDANGRLLNQSTRALTLQ